MDRHALSTLFPPHVATAELWNLAEASALAPEETPGTERMAHKRRREFIAGRDCGRRALRQLGYDAGIPRGERGVPQGPAGTVGSITHTESYAAAAVAKKADCLGIGLDAETVGRLKKKLWPSVFTPDERAWLENLDAYAQAISATVIFSAKEAFYKSQFVTFGLELGFHDADIAVGAGTFTVRAQADLPHVRGTFCVVDDKVLTAAVIG